MKIKLYNIHNVFELLSAIINCSSTWDISQNIDISMLMNLQIIRAQILEHILEPLNKKKPEIYGMCFWKYEWTLFYKTNTVFYYYISNKKKIKKYMFIFSSRLIIHK